MAQWNKIITSGSDSELNSLSSSLLNVGTQGSSYSFPTSSGEVAQVMTMDEGNQISFANITDNLPVGTLSSSAQIENYNKFATTGSNTFVGDQMVTGSLTVSSSNEVLFSSIEGITFNSENITLRGNRFGNDWGDANVIVSGTLFTTSTTVMRGQVIIGDNLNDEDLGGPDLVSFNTRVNTAFIPSGSREFDLGSGSNEWRDIYAQNLYATASLATTASLALQAESANTAESATSASYIQAANIDGEITASTVDFDNITNKPVLYSGSSQLVSALDGQDITLGTVTAAELVTEIVSSSVSFSTGSNIFGDELTDNHEFTGSLSITGSLNVVGNIDSVGRINTDDSMRSVFVGRDAGENENSGFRYNTGIGYVALQQVTTGLRNTGLGFQAAGFTTTGNDNIGIGYFAGLGVQTGIRNVYIGTEAGGTFSSGGGRSENTAVGYYSQQAATTANNNSTFGSLSGQSITTGGHNTLVGWRAGAAITTGRQNVALGSNAAYQNMNGTGNIIIGYNTAVSSSTDNNTIVIGSNTTGSGLNTTTIGTTTTTLTKLFGSLEIDGITDVSASIAALEDFSSSLDSTFATDSDLQILIDETGSYATTGSNTFTGNQTINASTVTIGDTGDARVIVNRSTTGDDSEIVFQTNGTEEWSIGTGQVGGESEFTLRSYGSSNVFRLTRDGDLQLNGNSNITASFFTGSFIGDGSQIEGVVSASHASTASYADKIKVDYVNDDFQYGLMLVSNPQDNNIQIGTTDQTTSDLEYNPLRRALRISGSVTASRLEIDDELTFLTATTVDLTVNNSGQGDITASNAHFRQDVIIDGNLIASAFDITASKALSVRNQDISTGSNIPMLFGVEDPDSPTFSFVTSTSSIYYRDGEVYTQDLNVEGVLKGIGTQISGAFTADSASFATVLDGVMTDVDNLMLFSASATSSLEELYDRTDALQSVTGSYITTASAQFDGNVGITGSLSVSQSIEIIGDITSVGKILQNREQRSTFIGFEAGQNEDDGNFYNVGLGYRTLCNLNNGTRNVAIGFNAMDSLDSGDRNVGIGSWAGAGVVGGNENTYVGVCAGADMSGGNRRCNVGIGYRAAYQATVGNNNTSIGTLAGENMTSGSGNVQIGWRAGNAVTTGQNNISIGTNSDWSNVCGNCNVVIGYNTRNGGTIDDHVIVIGANAVGRGDHTVTIGSSIISSSRLYGTLEIDGISDVSASIAALEAGDIVLPDGTVSSSAQLATDISGALSNTAISSLGAGIASSSLQITNLISGQNVTLGTVNAQEIITEIISSSVTLTTGSNIFGDEITDTHEFTGSISVSGSVTATSFNGVFDGALSSSAQIATDISGALSNVAIAGLSAGIVSSSAQLSTEISGAFDSIDTVSTASSVHGSQVRINASGSHGIDTLALDSSGGFRLSVGNNSAIRIGDTTTTNSSIAINGTSGVHLNTNNAAGAELQVSAEAITDGTDDSPNLLAVGADGRLQTSNITVPASSLPGDLISSSAQLAADISGSLSNTAISTLGAEILSSSNGVLNIRTISASNDIVIEGRIYGDGSQLTGVSASAIQNGLLFGDGLLGGTFTGVLDVTSSIDTSSAHFITGSIEALENHAGLTLDGTITTANTASFVEYTNIYNLPTLISSSAQLASDISGSLSATAISTLGLGIVSSSAQIDNLFDIDNLVSSSTQITNLGFISESFSTDGTGILSSSAQISTDISGSFTNTSASIASDISASLTRINSLEAATFTTDGTNIVSSSAQISTEISGAFTANSSSLANRITNIVTDFTTLTDRTLVSSSAQIASDISGAFDAVSASLASDIAGISTDFNDITNKPVLYSGSTQLVSALNGQDITLGRVNASEIVTEIVSSSVSFSTGSNIFGDELTDNHEFTGSITVTGSITATSFTGDGSGLTGVTADGTLSSSAQIATDISGAFDAVSASLATNISNITNGDTTVTSASHALTASIAQALEMEDVDMTDQQFTFALINTASRSVVSYDTEDLLFNPNTGELEITGLTVTNFTISGSNTGQGTIRDALTASLANNAQQADNADTASLAQEVELTTMASMVNTYYPMLSTRESGSTPVMISSSLYYDRSSETLFVPNFSGSFAGDIETATTASYVAASAITNVTTYRQTVSGATSYAITHNLNEQYPIVQAWNTSNNQMEIPASITSDSVNQVTVDFGLPFAGQIVVKI